MKFEDALTNPQKTEKERVNILMNHHGWKLFLKKKEGWRTSMVQFRGTGQRNFRFFWHCT
jgi:hypothetical protein